MRKIVFCLLTLLTFTCYAQSTNPNEKIELKNKQSKKESQSTMRIPTLEIQAYFDSQYLWIESAQTIENGVLAPGNATTGELYIDDEDDDNKNWAKLYIGRTFDKDLTPRMNCFSPYGMTLGINTNYSLTFSNTSEFKSKNIYYSIY
ncbi:MAG: hypothetical protein IJ511_04860 [Bacteroides sp.]|nr:hypothetical protein [Bacteroides sp.]